jgi:CheY-like chemotaxis protein
VAYGGNRRVLIVDDDLLVARAVARMMTGAAVVVESDARAALRRIEGGEIFDAILCDLGMPAMSGAAFFRALPAACRARVVFMTGGRVTGADDDLERLANPVLEKPFTMDEARAALARVGTNDG